MERPHLHVGSQEVPRLLGAGDHAALAGLELEMLSVENGHCVMAVGPGDQPRQAARLARGSSCVVAGHRLTLVGTRWEAGRRVANITVTSPTALRRPVWPTDSAMRDANVGNPVALGPTGSALAGPVWSVPSDGRPSDMGRRSAAAIIDWLLLSIVFVPMLAEGLRDTLHDWVTSLRHGWDPFTVHALLWSPLDAAVAACVVVSLAYFSVGDGALGATLGKRVTGQQVVSSASGHRGGAPGGGRIGLGRGLVRTACTWGPLVAIILPISDLLAFAGLAVLAGVTMGHPDHRSPGDRAVGSEVILRRRG